MLGAGSGLVLGFSPCYLLGIFENILAQMSLGDLLPKFSQLLEF